MADKTKLAETLQKLDVNNENHWTADGSPRLETVKFLNGGEAVSREEIDEHFKDFNKSNASDYNWTGQTGDINPGQDAEGNLTGVQAPGAGGPPPELYNPATSQPAAAPGSSGPQAAGELTESPREDGAGAAAQASQPGEGDGAEGATPREAQLAEVEQRLADTDEVEDLEEELEAVEEALSDLRRQRDDLNKDIDEGNAHADKLRGRIAQLKGSEQTNTIQSYLESRKEAMTLRGENRATLKAAGLTLKGITQAVAPAPIDSAMARKNTWGTKRPTRV